MGFKTSGLNRSNFRDCGDLAYVCTFSYNPAVAKEFVIPNVTEMKGLGCLPGSVVQAALGGVHKPVNPHRQRLLVAANKATECEKVPGAVSSKAKAKSKPAAKKAAEAKKEEEAEKEKPAATAEQPESPKPTTSTGQPKKKRAAYADTAYNVARKKFLQTSLDSNFTQLDQCL